MRGGALAKGDQVKLVGVSETLPDVIARATREDVIPQTQGVKRPGVPESLIFSDWKKMKAASSGTPERAEPIAYMVDRIRKKLPLDGPSDLDLNVSVQEVLEAAKLSVKTGRAIPLPLM